MTETQVAELLRDLKELEEQDLIPPCIATCRFALKRLPRSDWKNRYKFGLRLVNYLINGMPEPLSARDSNDAIRTLRGLRETLPAKERERRARCGLFLGFLFQNRLQGSRLSNLRQALTHYSRARHDLHGVKYKEPWAAATAALAEVHEELDRSRLGLDRAVKLTKEALRVYTAKEFPQDHDIYSRSLANLRARQANKRIPPVVRT